MHSPRTDAVRAALLWIAFLTLAPGALGDGTGEQSARPIPDSELSIYPGSVFEVPVPERVAENTTFPGEGALPPRLLPEFPPVVPHGVADFLPVTRTENYCVDCHGIAVKEEGEPTPIPASHAADPAAVEGAVDDELSGRRHLCLACHVARTDAAPLVDNRLARPRGEPVEGGGR